jgi:hypothetical protein
VCFAFEGIITSFAGTSQASLDAKGAMISAKDAMALRNDTFSPLPKTLPKGLRKGTESPKAKGASLDTKCAKQRKEGRYCCKEISLHLCSKGLKHLEVENT